MSQSGEGGGEVGTALALIGQGIGQLLGAALGATTQWQSLMSNVRSIRSQIQEMRRTLMALTTAQQQAINELSSGIETLSENLGDVLDAAQQVRSELAAMTQEEGREQAERERLEALLAQMDSDVVNALTPLASQINQMNSSLKTPEENGGSPITPTDPSTPDAPATPDEGI